MKTCFWMVCLGLVFSSFALAADEKNKAVQPAKPSLTVVLVKPQQASMLDSVLANGSLAAWQEAIIGAEANGLKITEVRVNVGDRVQRGDVLASLQADSLRAELAQAEGTLAEAAASAQEAKAQLLRCPNHQRLCGLQRENVLRATDRATQNTKNFVSHFDCITPQSKHSALGFFCSTYIKHTSKQNQPSLVAA